MDKINPGDMLVLVTPSLVYTDTVQLDALEGRIDEVCLIINSTCSVSGGIVFLVQAITTKGVVWVQTDFDNTDINKRDYVIPYAEHKAR